MKTKPKVANLIIFGFIIITLIACKADEEDQCDDWKYNEKWDKIISSSSCSAEQKGEAYLALGGFDYFNLIRYKDEPFATVLGLGPKNISRNQYFFDKAAEAVEPISNKSSGIAKTIYLFGTFAGAYTYLTENLDQGVDGSADGFDGIFSSYEINAFLGTDVSEDSNDLNNMAATDTYQIKSSGDYYLYDSSADQLFEDDLADGIEDTSVVEIVDNPLSFSYPKTTILANATAIFQVTELNSISNPLSGATSKDASEITGFADKIAVYLQQIKTSLQVLDIDETSSVIEDVTTLQNQLDNGGVCQTFEVGSALNFLNTIVEKTRKEQSPADSYASDNILSTSDILSDASSDSSSDNIFTDISNNALFPNVKEFGVKLKFKDTTGDGFVAYWDGAHEHDIKTPMLNLSAITNNDLTAGDGKIALTEILCAGKLISGEEE